VTRWRFFGGRLLQEDGNRVLPVGRISPAPRKKPPEEGPEKSELSRRISGFGAVVLGVFCLPRVLAKVL